MKKVKTQALSMGFFSYFTWGIPFKAKRSSCTNIWKFKAKIARNATSEGHKGQIFDQFGSKMAKLVIFKKFNVVSQS